MRKFLCKTVTFLLGLLFIICSLEELSSWVVNKQSNFELNKSVKNLIIGHSHSELAFNDTIIKNTKNISESGESYFYTYSKTRKIIESSPHLTTVFVEFTNNSIDKKMNEWTFSCYNMGYRLEKFSNFISVADKVKLFYNNPICYSKTMINILKERFDNFVQLDFNYKKELGSYKIKDNKKLTLDQNLKDNNQEIETDNISALNMDYLNKLVNVCHQNNKRVVFVRSPQRIDYPFWANERIFQEVRRQNFPDVEFVDLSKLDSITNEDFLDAAHLNSKGARKVSSWLNEWITTN